MNEVAIHLKLSVNILHTWSWTQCSALARRHREKRSIVVLLCLKAEEFYICMKCCYVHSASAPAPPVCTPYRSKSRHRVQQDVVFWTRRQSFYCDWQGSVLSQGLLDLACFLQSPVSNIESPQSAKLALQLNQQCKHLRKQFNIFCPLSGRMHVGEKMLAETTESHVWICLIYQQCECFTLLTGSLFPLWQE